MIGRNTEQSIQSGLFHGYAALVEGLVKRIRADLGIDAPVVATGGLAPIFDGGRSVVLCPQGPLAFQAGPGPVGYGWFPIRTGAPTDPEEVQKGVDALQRFLDEALAQYPVDRHKVAILGFSQGGVMAYQLALRSPAAYAGLIALSSWLPEQMAQR